MFSRKGFTILELLIVVAVIGILVGIALPRFKGLQDEGNIAKAKGDLRTLQTAMESYLMHNSNALPASLTTLTTASPKIVSVIPNDPFNSGNPYTLVKGTAPYYTIYSKGPTPGGSCGAPDDTTGIVTEVNGQYCIYVTNGSPVDTQP
jgi:prepilin-type N-terminal cleavage/methylation domain-containing protein